METTFALDLATRKCHTNTMKEKGHCDPAASILACFDNITGKTGVGRREDGATFVARNLGISYTTANRWRLPDEEQGTGGKIPWKYRGRIRELAAFYGKTLVSFD